ncbi:MAG: ABC transporter ATP-binding protein [Polyangiaceae bacterium]
MRLLLNALHVQRRGAACGVLAGVSWTCTKLTMPVLVRRGIDLGIRAGDQRQLAISVGLILVVGLLQAGFAGFRRYFGISVAARVEADLRARLFVHLLRLDLGFHAQTPAGQLVSRSASDLQQIQQPFVNIPLTVSNAIMLLGATLLLLRVDATLAVIALSPALCVFVLARKFTSRLAPRAQRLQQSISALASTLQESLSGIRAIKGLGLEPVERKRASAQAEQTFDAALRLNDTRATFLPLLDFLPAAGLVGVLWVGGQRVLTGTLTIGELVQFNYYLLMLVGPLRIAGITLAQFERAVVSATLIASLLDVQPSVRDLASSVERLPVYPERSRAVSSAARGGEIQFESVDFGYTGSEPLLRELELRIAPGEVVALVGATGSGKTTLTALIARFYDVTRGCVRIDGVDVRDLPLSTLRSNIGMVFEDALLFSGSIRDNIAFGSPAASDEEIERAARAAGAHDFAMEQEGGYAALVGERGFRLSGGQRQRIALARALLHDPRVLVLDAATSAVDAEKEAEIQEALTQVLKNRTAIVITHRAATLQLADRVLLLADGRITETGTHGELLERSATYRGILASSHPSTNSQPSA